MVESQKTIYVISKGQVLEALDAVSAEYSGLLFGGCTPDELRTDIIAQFESGDPAHVSSICQIIHDKKTPKLLSGANQGLNELVRRVNAARVRQ